MTRQALAASTSRGAPSGSSRAPAKTPRTIGTPHASGSIDRPAARMRPSWGVAERRCRHGCTSRGVAATTPSPTAAPSPESHVSPSGSLAPRTRTTRSGSVSSTALRMARTAPSGWLTRTTWTASPSDSGGSGRSWSPKTTTVMRRSSPAAAESIVSEIRVWERSEPKRVRALTLSTPRSRELRSSREAFEARTRAGRRRRSSPSSARTKGRFRRVAYSADRRSAMLRQWSTAARSASSSRSTSRPGCSPGPGRATISGVCHRPR